MLLIAWPLTMGSWHLSSQETDLGFIKKKKKRLFLETRCPFSPPKLFETRLDGFTFFR